MRDKGLTMTTTPDKYLKDFNRTTMIRKTVHGTVIRELKEVKSSFATIYLMQLTNLLSYMISGGNILNDKQFATVLQLEKRLLEIAENADESERQAIEGKLGELQGGFDELLSSR